MNRSLVDGRWSMVEVVSAAAAEIAERVIMPRFRTLLPDDIMAKQTPGDPEDVVTIADHEAERALIDSLSGLVPNAVFIGEEAVSSDAAHLDALASPAPVWLIDPIDGTKNFAHGDANFGVMLALVEQGITRASWMHMPALATGRTIAAQQGAGTRVDGIPVRLEREPSAGVPRGTIHTRLMPPATAADVLRRLDGRFAPRASTGSAAIEYSEILRGDKDFVIYYRLLPWDHAPGALALAEAGGDAVHVTGLPYTPRSPDQVTIFAATSELAGTIRRWLTV